MLKLTLFGICCSFDFWFFAQLFVCALFLSGQQAAFLLLCAGHEAAHLLAACALGEQVTALRFRAGSIAMQTAGVPSAARCKAISAAGPLFNLAAAAVLLAAGCEQAARFSLVLAFFNLLPAGDTDGAVLCSSCCKTLRAAAAAACCCALVWLILRMRFAASGQTLLAVLLFFLTSLPSAWEKE